MDFQSYCHYDQSELYKSVTTLGMHTAGSNNQRQGILSHKKHERKWKQL